MSDLEGELKTDAYDQALVDITSYVFQYNIDNPQARERSRLALLDALGCAIESHSSLECANLIGPITPGIIVPNGFRLPASGNTTSARSHERRFRPGLDDTIPRPQ